MASSGIFHLILAVFFALNWSIAGSLDFSSWWNGDSPTTTITPDLTSWNGTNDTQALLYTTEVPQKSSGWFGNMWESVTNMFSSGESNRSARIYEFYEEEDIYIDEEPTDDTSNSTSFNSSGSSADFNEPVLWEDDESDVREERHMVFESNSNKSVFAMNYTNFYYESDFVKDKDGLIWEGQWDYGKISDVNDTSVDDDRRDFGRHMEYIVSSNKTTFIMNSTGWVYKSEFKKDGQWSGSWKIGRKLNHNDTFFIFNGTNMEIEFYPDSYSEINETENLTDASNASRSARIFSFNTTEDDWISSEEDEEFDNSTSQNVNSTDRAGRTVLDDSKNCSVNCSVYNSEPDEFDKLIFVGLENYTDFNSSSTNSSERLESSRTINWQTFFLQENCSSATNGSQNSSERSESSQIINWHIHFLQESDSSATNASQNSSERSESSRRINWQEVFLNYTNDDQNVTSKKGHERTLDLEFADMNVTNSTCNSTGSSLPEDGDNSTYGARNNSFLRALNMTNPDDSNINDTSFEDFWFNTTSIELENDTSTNSSSRNESSSPYKAYNSTKENITQIEDGSYSNYSSQVPEKQEVFRPGSTHNDYGVQTTEIRHSENYNRPHSTTPLYKTRQEQLRYRELKEGIGRGPNIFPDLEEIDSQQALFIHPPRRPADMARGSQPDQPDYFPEDPFQEEVLAVPRRMEDLPMIMCPSYVALPCPRWMTSTSGSNCLLGGPCRDPRLVCCRIGCWERCISGIVLSQPFASAIYK